MSAPPPPPPPPQSVTKQPPRGSAPKPPTVAATAPAGAFLVELLIYNGSPFKDHWAYWVRSHQHQDIGVLLHATGDVKNGFKFEIKRSHDFRATGNRPTSRIPLQWVDAKYFDEKLMLNNGVHKFDSTPVCLFEASVHKIKAPGKTLKTVKDQDIPTRKITQRNCQTWIVESADQLVRDGIFVNDAAVYLHAIEQ